MTDTVLVVVAHSDDETISMAGTIRKHVNRGDIVHVISMTDGVTARMASNDEEVMKRKLSAISASKVLGFEWGDCYRFSDNGMDSYPLIKIIKSVERAKLKYRPTLVYTWDSKLKALKAYTSEMREYPHSRSIDGILNLARIRGNQVGYDLAEAFEVIRKLDD